jgi:hypothetical protein
VSNYGGTLASTSDQHEIRPREIAACLIGRHCTHELHQRGDAESLDSTLQRTTLRPVTDDSEREVVTAGGKHRHRFEAQLHPAGAIKPTYQHCPATTTGPGMSSALNRQRVDVFGSYEAAGQVLNRFTQRARDSRHHGCLPE